MREGRQSTRHKANAHGDAVHWVRPRKKGETQADWLGVNWATVAYFSCC